MGVDTTSAKRSRSQTPAASTSLDSRADAQHGKTVNGRRPMQLQHTNSARLSRCTVADPVKILYSKEDLRAVSAQAHLEDSSQARRPHTRTSTTQRERHMHTRTQDVIIHIDLAVICLEPYTPGTGTMACEDRLRDMHGRATRKLHDDDTIEPCPVKILYSTDSLRAVSAQTIWTARHKPGAHTPEHEPRRETGIHPHST